MNEIKTKLEKKYRGITLISLVITIIVLLIIAGVTINLILGQNGIFNEAKYAKEEYGNAVKSEEERLNELYEYLQGGNLPENKPQTDAGTIVAMPSEWQTSTVKYALKQNGEIIDVKQVASVYAISDGQGQTAPIPVGFYYVGGTIASGVVISDNINDKDKYAGQADVPNGLEYTIAEDGTTVTQVKEILQGNQFVWIPCDANSYKKTNTFKLYSGGYETSTPSAELTQIENYGGFYVARYEAGLASSITADTDGEVLTSSIYNVAGTPQSKAGIIPWNFISWTKAQENSQLMGLDQNYTSVTTGLITGTQWDVMLNKIASSDSTKSLTNSGSWGNYYTGSTSIENGSTVNYFKFTGKYATHNNILSAFSTLNQANMIKPNSSSYLLTTGASEHNKAYNLYDVAGNVWEWTEEISGFGTNLGNCRVARSGGCENDSSSFPVSCRHGSNDMEVVLSTIGFRTVLYIK